MIRIVYVSGNQGLPKKLRKKIPRNNVLAFLNKDISEVGLSPLTIEGLKTAGFDQLKDFRKAVIENTAPLNTLGLRSRLEINRFFKRNNVELPANWFWRP